jgi:hypothetical protein
VKFASDKKVRLRAVSRLAGILIASNITKLFSDIAPSIPSVQLVLAIAQQAQQMFGVVPPRACKVLFQRIAQRADGTPRSARSSASLKGPDPYIVFPRSPNLKRMFDL